ncbi:MAG: fibronectin type III domain-containing protein [Bacteroidales bacterium]|nr:fibronectin type III domain-containing protein [Bacteroidales bacterium]
MRKKYFSWMLIFLLFSFSATKSIAQENKSDWGGMMQDPTSNVYDAYKVFNNYWASNQAFQEYKELEEEGVYENEAFEEPRHIFKRWFFDMAPRVYPTGEQVNPTKALYEYKNFSINNPSTKGTSNWVSLGPTNPTGYTNNGSYQSPGGSGRVNAIAFDPNNSSIIWVGTPAGGLWKSTNGGTTWTLKNAGLEVAGVSAIVIDPTNTNIIYIGTGDRDAGDTRSIGILKSTDGGTTWNTTSVTFTTSQGARCSDILMNPNDHNVLLASFNGVVYKTTDGFATKSTVLSETIWDMEFKPGDPNTVYAAGTKVYKSTNGGTSFTQVTSGVPTSNVQRLELAVSAAAPDNVWMLYGRTSANDYDFGGVYKSTNSAGSFSSIYSGNLGGWETNPSSNSGGQSFYDITIAVNPSNANEIFVGGVNLYKSTNGGTSWACNAYWLDGSSYEYAHADYHAIEYQNSSTLFIGNDGGIFKSTNNGGAWTDISNNMNIAQVAKIGCSATNPNLIMTGMQDNGTNKFNGSTWSIVYGGDGCEALVDPTNDNIIYASYVYGALYKSTNGGSSWSSIKASTESSAWITPYVMDPNNHNTLYAGYTNVYKSTNAGSSWTKIGTATGSGTIVELELAPSNTSYIYYIKEYWNGSSMSYTVGKTTNGGSTWSSIGTGLPLSSAAPTSITVSTNDPQTLWVTFSGYVAGTKVYKSTNAGSSWTNVSGNLPNMPVNAVVYQDGSDDGIYVGCDVGVYYRDNSMSDWEDYSVNLPKTVIKELEIYYDDANPSNSKLRAATYGRSVWETPLASAPSTCNAPTSLQATDVTTTTAKLTWTAASGALTYDVRYKATSSGTWNEQNTSNTYLNIGGLNTDVTQYEFQVRTNCSEGPSAYTESAYFGYTPVTYCESKGNSATDEWIGAFALGSINNTSGNNGGYGDFTAMSSDLNRGENASFSITPTWAGTKYNEGYAIWIDYNHDGDFEDSGEQVFTKAASQTTPVTGSFTVPADAQTGETRLRVILKYNAIPASSCGTYDYGETEDYTVNIVNGGDNIAPSAPTSLTSNNVTTTTVDLSWTASTDNVGVTGYDIYRNGTKLGTVAGTSSTVSGLTASTTYSFYVIAYDAAGNHSAESNVIQVTTNANPDTQAPSAPTGLAYSNVTQISCDLSWNVATDNIGVTNYKVYKDGAFVANSSTTNYSVNGLSAGTTYQFYVKAEDAAGNLSNASTAVSVTTESAGITYCTSKGNSVNDEWIQKVQIGQINNNSGANGGYGDFTNLSTPIYRGNSTTITITPAWSGTLYNEGYAVWIDYNQDGDFEDSGELVYSKAASQTNPVVGTFTVSTGSTLGVTRMRVSMRYNAIPPSCGNFDYGEVEDYTVDIQDAGDIQAPTAPSNLASSSVTTTSVQLSWTASTDNIGVTGYKIYKNGALLTSVTGTSYNVTSLTASTSYSFYVIAFDAAGNNSSASNTVNVTTNSAPDTQAPTVPSSLVASDITQTTLNLSWNASSDNVGVTGYDVYKNGALLASTANLSFTATGLTASTSYSFYVKAKDAAGNVSSASNTVNATTEDAGGVTYCDSKGNSVSDEWIQKVVLGTINNNSGANGGYADFTAMSSSIVKGSNQTITITPGWSGTVYAEGYSVWIDYNQDGDFTDAGEQVVSIAANKNTPNSASFVVSSSALNGNTRMRVSMSYNAIPASCGTFNYGEVEDYTVSISGDVDTQAPTAPTSLASGNVAQTEFDLTWTASTDNIGVAGYKVYKNGSLLSTVTSTSVHVTGLTAGSTNSFYVKAFDAAGNESAQSNTVNVTMLTATISYCASKGSNVSYEWLNRVQFNTIDKTSGANGGYADFTSISTSVSKGTSYNITLTPGFAGTTYNEGYGVWIDYNQDGDFADAGELVYTHAKTTAAVTGSFTISNSAVDGSTRMRITMSYDETPSNPCASYTYGEVEDYTVVIGAKGMVNINEELRFVNVYPNPSSSVVTVELSDVSDKTQMYIYSVTGSLVKTVSVLSEKTVVDISELADGLYNIKVVDEKGNYNAIFIKQ